MAFQFFWQKIQWHDPLHCYAFLRKKKAAPQLLYSAINPPVPNGGKYSFVPFLPKETLLEEDLLRLFKESYHSSSRKVPEDIPTAFSKFCGGLCGFLSYEFAQYFDLPVANDQKNSLQIPKVFFQRFETLFAFDHEKKQCFLGGWFEDAFAAEEFFEEFAHSALYKRQECERKDLIHFSPQISEQEYTEAIDRIHQELKQGTTYQVNFSQKWSAQTESDAFDVFQILAKKNPAPMMYFCEHEDFAVLSCTPERLFSLQDGRLFAQPIKGTRRRGQNLQEDKKLREELLNDPKELAEHTMIVDLIRNDFGRVATFDSVQVAEFLRPEKYASVIHLVSDISANISAGKNAFHALQALFPGGSITGAPKRETMRIIAELEKEPRQAYCGSAGYISYTGNADFNILIRTLQKKGENVELRAGGGIVIGSSAEREYAESLEKAQGILHAFSG